jgi:DNA polymerase elongation subunit (family B)
MKTYNGWLFDLYEHPTNRVVLWLVGEDGKPYSFHQDFETIFYARGSVEKLHDLAVFIRMNYPKEIVRLKRVTDKEDLFDGPQDVLGIGISNTKLFKKLFREIQENFFDLIFYDVDIPLTVRYAAAHNVFMMAHCEIEAEPDGKLVSVKALDAPDELETKLPRLRVLNLLPDTDPSYKPPKYLIVKFGKSYLRIPFDKPHELLSVLNGVLSSFDPDVIHTHFGDDWLFPYLHELSIKTGIPFNLNRDLSMPVLRHKEVMFRSYGHAHYRAPQVHLRGRWHVDVENCMTYNKYHLLGAIEQVRLSSLPFQEVARRSPGAAMSAMQVLTAMKIGKLVPYQHQKGEIPKTFNEYFKAARGGLVLQPPLGIFENVGVLDFSSKMASIMIKYNVSPETVVSINDEGEGFDIPELGVKVLFRPGLMQQTLKPMVDKRLALKRLLKSMDKNDPRYRDTHSRYKVLTDFTDKKEVTDALKWLLVVCYGRLRFANSIFGRINAHEVVSYLSRKMITKAKLIAEAKGYVVLHLYVDSLFVSRPNATREDFQVLADAIEQETKLPMELENVYYWFAFLSSRENPNVSVSNKFFSVAENGEHKIRGVAQRRGDTCIFVASLQMKVIEILAKEKDPAKLINLVPEILEMTEERLSALKKREIPLNELVVAQTLSRELDGYSVLSPPSVAARQLQAQGKKVRAGQQIRFMYIGPGPGVHAWGLPTEPDSSVIDIPRYKELAFRAVYEVLQPLGITEKTLKDWIFKQATYVMPANLTNHTNRIVKQELPLFANLDHICLART